ncbi:hypothetical protein OBBRIDRAFT_441078 [Obba rivulosa]|uniref:Secreted protein n=1 Tax=Obba rivulosa TaxID=1052685 RepID=A0A8E2DUE2_9APHY|nr:hypothetical protein OBBRIDRAFT_441078 [Obba rivulosa]
MSLARQLCILASLATPGTCAREFRVRPTAAGGQISMQQWLAISSLTCTAFRRPRGTDEHTSGQSEVYQPIGLTAVCSVYLSRHGRITKYHSCAKTTCL